jgi:hypothetical protein
MSEIDKLKSAADILQQVDITDMISNMGIGIAKAQEQLDNNSVKQALALADPAGGFGGKSLLELGFVPAFYSFQFADISAEIELKMRLATEFEIGGSVSVDFNKQGGYSKENLDFLRNDESSSHREEFKSSRNFSTTANNYESITIESEEIIMEETDGVVDRLEKFNNDIQAISTVDRSLLEIDSSKYIASNAATTGGAILINSGGYIVITLPEAATGEEGILAISDYTTDTNIDISASDEFDTGTTSTNTTFGQVFAVADALNGAGTVTGFNSDDNKYYNTTSAPSGEVMELYFDFNKHNAKLALDEVLVDSVNAVTEDNTTEKPMFELLAKVLQNDTNAKIKITGYTDGSGSVGYNKLLSKRRAESLKTWLVDKGATDGQITTFGKAEDLAGADQTKNLTYRKVIVEFTTGVDYFHFLGGVFDSSSATSSVPANDFTYLEIIGGGTSPTYTISFDVDGSIIIPPAASFASLTDITSFTAVQDNFSTQIIDNSAYLLHNESRIKYSVYSKQKENMVFQTGSNKAETFEDSESKYLVDETSNTTTRIKKDSESIENPSTVAAGVSIEGRYSRQFSIDVSGNARIAARLVALPAPTQFVEQIKDTFNQ